MRDDRVRDAEAGRGEVLDDLGGGRAGEEVETGVHGVLRVGIAGVFFGAVFVAFMGLTEHGAGM
ncbi:hypothetical protein GCM10010363_61940 [Streptomyces omiyaensis]|nr:hypothetical protein GCM10010363_61940 [Streptomyces omiyaensis]